ncbi:MAG: SCO family protein [Acidobacteria bacterium]|nr:SCO family protein [Acidobacteriota bacterium]
MSSNKFVRGRLVLFALLSSIACASLGCQHAERKASAQAKRYELKGTVVAVDKAKKEVTISHDDIKDYMPGMTMPFPLKDDWAFDVLAPGSKVSATLVVDTNSYWLEGIVVSATVGDPLNTSTGDAPELSKVGQEVPDFKLINQDGKSISLKEYRGKALLLTFIYTRCPLPQFCTLMSTNFADLNKKMLDNPALKDRTHLLSITIDPAYDTPKVLRSYGAAHTGQYANEQFEHWEFATGKADEIKRLAEYFGLTYFEEQQQITHSLRTAIIAPDGKVYKVYAGNDWQPNDVLREVETMLGAGS